MQPILTGLLIAQTAPPSHWWWDAIVLAQLQVVLNVMATAIAIGAIWLAARVARQQLALMSRQDKIIERQASVFEAQLLAQERVLVTLAPMYVEGRDHLVHFEIQNGTVEALTIRWWHLLAPADDRLIISSDQTETAQFARTRPLAVLTKDGFFEHKEFVSGGYSPKRELRPQDIFGITIKVMSRTPDPGPEFFEMHWEVFTGRRMHRSLEGDYPPVRVPWPKYAKGTRSIINIVRFLLARRGPVFFVRHQVLR